MIGILTREGLHAQSGQSVHTHYVLSVAVHELALAELKQHHRHEKECVVAAAIEMTVNSRADGRRVEHAAAEEAVVEKQPAHEWAQFAAEPLAEVLVVLETLD